MKTQAEIEDEQRRMAQSERDRERCLKYEAPLQRAASRETAAQQQELLSQNPIYATAKRKALEKYAKADDNQCELIGKAYVHAWNEIKKKREIASLIEQLPIAVREPFHQMTETVSGIKELYALQTGIEAMIKKGQG